jgi:hypothetical protein
VEPEPAFLTSMVFTECTNPSLTRQMMPRVIRAIIRQADLGHLEGAQRRWRLMLTIWNGGLNLLSAEYSCVQS